MKNRTAEEILSFTFNQLETVLQGKNDEQDDFVRKTTRQANALYSRHEDEGRGDGSKRKTGKR